MQAVTAVLLQRGVNSAALPLHNGNRHFPWRQQLDQTKVHQLYQPGRGELQIGGFYIPMHNRRLLSVQVLQGIPNLDSPIQNIFLVQKALLGRRFGYQRAQVVPRYVIHHQIVVIADGKVIRNLGQVGMVQPGKHSGFLQELFAGFLQQLGRERRIIADLLDRAETPAEAGIFRQIDAAESALTNDAVNAIAVMQKVAFGGTNGHGCFSFQNYLRAPFFRRLGVFGTEPRKIAWIIIKNYSA